MTNTSVSLQIFRLNIPSGIEMWQPFHTGVVLGGGRAPTSQTLCATKHLQATLGERTNSTQNGDFLIHSKVYRSDISQPPGRAISDLRN